MIIIPLDTKHRLVSETLSWVLQQKLTRKHRRSDIVVAEWKPIRWYVTLESALLDFAELHLRVNGQQDIHDAMREVKSLIEALGTRLQRHISQSKGDETCI